MTDRYTDTSMLLVVLSYMPGTVFSTLHVLFSFYIYNNIMKQVFALHRLKKIVNFNEINKGLAQ